MSCFAILFPTRCVCSLRGLTMRKCKPMHSQDVSLTNNCKNKYCQPFASSHVQSMTWWFIRKQSPSLCVLERDRPVCVCRLLPDQQQALILRWLFHSLHCVEGLKIDSLSDSQGLLSQHCSLTRSPRHFHSLCHFSSKWLFSLSHFRVVPSPYWTWRSGDTLVHKWLLVRKS